MSLIWNRLQKMCIWTWLRAVLFCMKAVSKRAVVSLFEAFILLCGYIQSILVMQSMLLVSESDRILCYSWHSPSAWPVIKETPAFALDLATVEKRHHPASTLWGLVTYNNSQETQLMHVAGEEERCSVMLRIWLSVGFFFPHPGKGYRRGLHGNLETMIK